MVLVLRRGVEGSPGARPHCGPVHLAKISSDDLVSRAAKRVFGKGESMREKGRKEWGFVHIFDMCRV
ncbi:hypothetical protein TorRG33x02_245290 [Trema orientale]|uniref:Uncharacterized protein n=1 Tax=Trema orientale TaxID=63057 RepID=A0A2P5DQ62_TREOI|nr:hypothetical protein TorRG33x02_245290 [Trema orientale]